MKKVKELETLQDRLDEVENREVHQDEIVVILARIKSLEDELNTEFETEKAFDVDIAEFESQVTELVVETRNQRTDESETKLKTCDETIQHLDDAKSNLIIKIKQLGALITQAQDLNSKSPEVIAEVLKM